jgi:competence protein ComEA
MNRPDPVSRLIRVVVLALALGLGMAATASAESAPRGRPHAALAGTVNLNQASEEALELLPGIGPAKAHRIVEWRGKHPFRKIEDVVRVKGIGKKTFARLRPYLAVSGETTLAEKPNEKDLGAEAR